MNIDQKRAIGLHVRLQNGLQDVFAAVQKFNISIVQSFLINEQKKYVVTLRDHDIHQEFARQKQQLNVAYFVHAAYWSSLMDSSSKEFKSLCKEAAIAARLTSDGLVVHVGATKTRQSKQDQAKYVADGLNELFSRVEAIPILLENGPHAGRNFGGDLSDFLLLNNLVEQRTRLHFCIDTAHAYVYGYDIATTQGQIEFFDLLTQLTCLDKITLLHLNDTKHACASKIDQHGVPGDGFLGPQVLQTCMLHPTLAAAPIILELPTDCNDSSTGMILQRIDSWQCR